MKALILIVIAALSIQGIIAYVMADGYATLQARHHAQIEAAIDAQ